LPPKRRARNRQVPHLRRAFFCAVKVGSNYVHLCNGPVFRGCSCSCHPDRWVWLLQNLTYLPGPITKDAAAQMELAGLEEYCAPRDSSSKPSRPRVQVESCIWKLRVPLGILRAAPSPASGAALAGPFLREVSLRFPAANGCCWQAGIPRSASRLRPDASPGNALLAR